MLVCLRVCINCIPIFDIRSTVVKCSPQGFQKGKSYFSCYTIHALKANTVSVSHKIPILCLLRENSC